jgi:hypothetical protein
MLSLSPLLVFPDPSASTGLSFDACAATRNQRFLPPTLSPKWLGDIAEGKFIVAAISHELAVLLPFGNCHPFDFGVVGRRPLLVQVKQTTFKRGPGWQVGLRRRNGSHLSAPYEPGDFDFLAVLVPGGSTKKGRKHEMWYIIPFEALAGYGAITLPAGPSKKFNRFAQYREAWHLLKTAV